MLLLFAGCGGGPEVAPVTGTVAVEGKKLNRGRVLFEPVDGGTPAVGIIDEAGSFALTTFEPGDGALVGKHRMSITQREGEGQDGQPAYNFSSPPDLIFDVSGDKQNAFDVDIDPSQGWQFRENR